MPKRKLTPEGEVIAAYGAAMVAAFQVLINCLEESDALLPGQYPRNGEKPEGRRERNDPCRSTRHSSGYPGLARPAPG
ncbi:hypothetical protein HU675_0011445 [Bradyrhizobium septentrionale]|uniref:hypothetical protein n=1 Tax=Bradyrhizobium septentrionale TaxID=1404411 RepID=UPI001596799A|nr:hypothetical protein [Bradyrhizobium septentrionale]UGY27315.1 hypothetical protein HU675_0011445 [Bradyrhizobium septentrionale]